MGFVRSVFFSSLVPVESKKNQKAVVAFWGKRGGTVILFTCPSEEKRKGLYSLGKREKKRAELEERTQQQQKNGVFNPADLFSFLSLTSQTTKKSPPMGGGDGVLSIKTAQIWVCAST